MAVGWIVLLTAVLTASLRAYDIWEKWRLARRVSMPHPLEPAVRDIAAAIREREWPSP